MTRYESLLSLWFKIQGYHKNAKEAYPGENRSSTNIRAEPTTGEHYSRYERWMLDRESELNKSGLLSIAFAFRDRLSRRSIFFEEGTSLGEYASNFQTPYIISTPRSGGLDLSIARATLHQAFLFTRSVQFDRFEQEGSGAPEFARLAQGQSFPSSPRKFRDLGILYADDEYIALAIYCWLRLPHLDQSAPLKKSWFERPGPSQGLRLEWMSRPLEILNKEANRVLQTRWKKIASNADSISRFLAKLLVSKAVDTHSLGEFDARAYQYLLDMCDGNDVTASKASEQLEDKCAVPILPYFLWAVLDPKPRAHIVAPIWTTISEYPSPHEAETGSSEATVGWAVASIQPLPNVSGAASGKSANPDSRLLGLTLASLQALARPAIDVIYYVRERDHLAESHEAEFVAKIMARNFSHNLGSQVIQSVVFQDDQKVSRELKELLSYIQDRMDYIYLISSTIPRWEVADSLQSALVHLLHENSLVLSNIVQSQRDAPPQIFLATPSATFSIPHGVVGRHALYAIFENIIRNAAKYGGNDRGRQLCLRVQILAVHLDGEDYLMMEIVDNNDSSEAVVAFLNETIGRPVYDPADKLASNINWGIKEIKISAAFLSGQTYVGRGQALPPKPEWFLGPEMNGNRGLGIRIWLRPAEGILVVSSKTLGEELPNGTLEPRLTHVAPRAGLASNSKKYEFLVVDVDDLFGPFESELNLAIAASRRTAIVGKNPPYSPMTQNSQIIATHWNSLLRTGAFRGTTSISSHIATLWARARWPQAQIVLVVDKLGKFPDLQAIADQIMVQPVSLNDKGQLSDATGAVLRSPIEHCAVFDHTQYEYVDGARDGNEVYSAFRRAAYFQHVSFNEFRIDPNEIAWRLIESAFLRVMVIHEEVWKRNDSKIDHKKHPRNRISFKEMWSSLGVEITDPVKVTWPRGRIRLDGIPLVRRQFDYLLVHRSLIDRWAHDKYPPTQDIDSQTAFNTFLSELLRVAKTVVLVSGRGPSPRTFIGNAQMRIRQIEFASLRDAMLVEEPNKLNLTQLITAL